jgi:hypothetical protein
MGMNKTLPFYSSIKSVTYHRSPVQTGKAFVTEYDTGIIPIMKTQMFLSPFYRFHHICNVARIPARTGNRQRRFSDPPVDTIKRPGVPSIDTPRCIF